jgi:hypothetical protein
MTPRTQNRREFLQTSVLAATGAAVTMNSLGADAPPSPPAGAAATAMPPRFHKGMPTGKLGKLTVSRLFIGCNQVSGYAHCRDLRYVSRLMRAYQTDEKVLDTWSLCEQHGINTLLSDPWERPVGLMRRYRQERRGTIQWLSEVHPKKSQYEITFNDMKENLKQVLDNGPDALYVQGAISDAMVQQGRVGELVRTLELMQASGLASGIGSHSIETPKTLMKLGAEPDFYVKTFHADDYWSATPQDRRLEFNVDSGSANDHDNIWDIRPEETRAVMARTTKPWIAFKVLAAGAIEPAKGFRFAFQGGADFICVGMFDFQVAENAGLARKLLTAELERARPWRA